EGKSENVLPDSAVLFSVDAPQIYRACADIFVNHWVHMDCDERDVFHQTTGLAFNKVLRLADSAEAEDILHMMSREKLSELPSREMYMDLLIKMLILKLGDSGAGNSAAAANLHYSELRQLRAEMYSSPGQYRSVEGIAGKVNLSPPHFQRLYKKQFGVSCYEDLLSAKTKAAQYYLKNTNMTVKEISSACGYENDVCFMRRFKQRTGLTPTEYREGK
ncbi:MAG: AraC family transcriptional regulator, partial [Muribaculaceae bacterium]|nr:AraC family transcriptional regulator [Muribaculaceae bacterium]